MSVRGFLVLALAVAWPHVAGAQTPGWQLRWAKGEVLRYRAKHVTSVTETADGSTVASSATVVLVKEWKVVDVDAQGVALLHMTLTSMRNEQKRPGGETLTYDSEHLDQSTPELREQMGKFLGKTLAVVRVDGFGRVVEVKLGNAARYEAELPFALVLPQVAPREGQVWDRPYTIVLEPPQGTGEKYAAVQRCKCLKVVQGKATIGVSTVFKTQPDTMQERLPFLQKELTGEAVVDVQGGRLLSIRYGSDKTVADHQGAGSSYRFQSQFTEELLLPEASLVTPAGGS